MRLVCPNCDAEYEVDVTLIPQEGRDVQCSNCSVTWFQKHPDAEQPRAMAEGDLKPQRPEVDSKALDIIREEVEREKTARQAESTAIETQGDLGLQEAPAQDKSSEEFGGVAAGDIAPAPRRAETTKKELFPDIEEINSTLADTPDPVDDPESEESITAKTSGRSGFRIGFGLMLMITAALLAVYVYAPQLIERFPEAEDALTAYVTLADKLRQALEVGAEGLLGIITDLTDRMGN